MCKARPSQMDFRLVYPRDWSLWPCNLAGCLFRTGGVLKLCVGDNAHRRLLYNMAMISISYHKEASAFRTPSLFDSLVNDRLHSTFHFMDHRLQRLHALLEAWPELRHAV